MTSSRGRGGEGAGKKGGKRERGKGKSSAKGRGGGKKRERGKGAPSVGGFYGGHLGFGGKFEKMSYFGGKRRKKTRKGRINQYLFVCKELYMIHQDIVVSLRVWDIFLCVHD